jgi:hypothetical protein
VADRLPKVEARLAEAKRLLFNRDREIAELSQGAKRHKLALEEASSINAQKAAEIDKLNDVLSSRPRSRRGQTQAEGEPELRTELEKLRVKVRDQANLIDRLQQREKHGLVAAQASASAPEAQWSGGTSEEQAVRTNEDTATTEREIAGLRAKAEDQAGEIARLRVALAAFERGETGGLSFKNSKMALKARADSAEAQGERQAATISRLRGELAAAHERLARQAASFADEMRRLGAGPGVTSSTQGADRGARRGNLLDRVAHVRPVISEPPQSAPTRTADASQPASAEANGNGHSPNGGKTQSEDIGQGDEAAAQMPQTEEIEERSKPRLRDRLIGLAKS